MDQAPQSSWCGGGPRTDRATGSHQTDCLNRFKTRNKGGTRSEWCQAPRTSWHGRCPPTDTALARWSQTLLIDSKEELIDPKEETKEKLDQTGTKHLGLLGMMEPPAQLMAMSARPASISRPYAVTEITPLINTKAESKGKLDQDGIRHLRLLGVVKTPRPIDGDVSQTGIYFQCAVHRPASCDTAKLKQIEEHGAVVAHAKACQVRGMLLRNRKDTSLVS